MSDRPDHVPEQVVCDACKGKGYIRRDDMPEWMQSFYDMQHAPVNFIVHGTRTGRVPRDAA